MVYPFPVVFFAKSFKVTGEKADHISFSLNSQVNFTCSARTANLIKVIIIIIIFYTYKNI
jgi:hypothetical protein